MARLTQSPFLISLLVLKLSLSVLGQGTQFITGPCTSDADCASSCCGFHSGKCAGPVIAQTRDGGCGFGDPEPNNNAAVVFFSTAGLTGPAPTPAGAAAAADSAPAPVSSASTNTGSGKAGTQFITGPCTSDADCASSCCGFNTGLCAGPVIAQERDGGCGFGNAQPNNIAALAFFSSQSAAEAAAAAATPAPAAADSSSTSSSSSTNTGPGNKAGTQFITGPCTSDADCASSCCGFNSGLCAGPVIAQERDGGCGFGDAQPNNIAALAFFSSESAAAAATAAPAAAVASTPDTSSSTNKGPGNKAGQQFITGACTSDADCASGCCGFNSGLCAGAIVAQERDGGCGFGDAQPNDNAAQALRGGTPTTLMTAVVASAAQGQSTNTGAGNGAGKQFITGPCLSDADCADGCCGFNTGLCAGPIVAQERDGGCGFGDAQPNDNAAQALRGQ